MITNVYVYLNGQVMTFDQSGTQMPDYQGRKEDVIPKIIEWADANPQQSVAIFYNVEWR
jgi:hypothetical protein